MTGTGIGSIRTDLRQRGGGVGGCSGRSSSAVGVGGDGSSGGGGRRQPHGVVVVVVDSVSVSIVNGSVRMSAVRIGMSERVRMGPYGVMVVRVRVLVLRVMVLRVRVMRVRVVRVEIGRIGKTEEVGQVLPPMFHAHRAHQRHAHLFHNQINSLRIHLFIFLLIIMTRARIYMHLLGFIGPDDINYMC